jgi:hypothetical protein
VQALVQSRGPAALTSIRDFIVKRKGYGSVMWPGPTDVTGLSLEDIVSIGQGKQRSYKGMQELVQGHAMSLAIMASHGFVIYNL